MEQINLTRSNLIEKLSQKFNLTPQKSEETVKIIIFNMIKNLSESKRIEIRRFGSFEIRVKEARNARNPKTGETVKIGRQYTSHFKAGQPLRERINSNKIKLVKNK
jgi:integration host factor subunit beta